jgi:predicted O-methyltransferase YrrM
VKVGAYLTQKMGYTNVSRLAGGIIGYDRSLREHAPREEPMFKGTNFVFDGRLGRAITDAALGDCVTCGLKTSRVSNCRNENCHKRIIQCSSCRTSYSGACSEPCQMRVVNSLMRSRRLPSFISSSTESREYDAQSLPSKAAPSEPVQAIGDYVATHSSTPPVVYHEIERNTHSLLPTGSHMVSGRMQGRLLAQLASMTREGRILELGTFTGYATVALLEGASNVASVLSASGPPLVSGCRAGGPFVLSLERDSRAYSIAAEHLRIVTEHGLDGDVSVQNLKQLRNVGTPIVLSDSMSYLLRGANGAETRCELVHVSDALATVESMAAGKWCSSNEQMAPFDLVFLDADKTRLLDYVEALLANDRVLKKGGYIVVDNVLWKGLVVNAESTGSTEVSSIPIAAPSALSSSVLADLSAENILKKNRRARKLASKMHRFNSAIKQDSRVEVLILPVRDGLSVIRKK